MRTKPLGKQTSTISQQNAAIKLMASGCTLRFTALVLGIKDSTIRQWFKRDTQFKAKLVAYEQGLKISSQYERAG
jgi:hypothetical protein